MARIVVEFNPTMEKFLKKNRIKTIFAHNFRICNSERLQRMKLEDAKNMTPSKIIALAFTWFNSVEGEAYWNGISIRALKWEKEEKV